MAMLNNQLVTRAQHIITALALAASSSNIGQVPVTAQIAEVKKEEAKAPAKENPKVQEKEALLRDGENNQRVWHCSGYPYLAIFGCLVSRTISDGNFLMRTPTDVDPTRLKA